MNQVLNYFRSLITSKVTSDGTCIGNRWVGRSRDLAESFDHSLSLGDDRDDRAGEHELQERLIERLSLVLAIVTLKKCSIGVHHLHSNDSITLSLDTSEHLTDQAAAHAIGFDEDQGSLRWRSHGAGL